MSLESRMSKMEEQLRVGKKELPESFDPAWFKGLEDGPITAPPPGVVLTPAQRETFDIVAAMHNSVGYGPEDGYGPDCSE